MSDNIKEAIDLINSAGIRLEKEQQKVLYTHEKPIVIANKIGGLESYIVELIRLRQGLERLYKKEGG